MRSKRGTPQSSRERSICSIPCSLPSVHTFVAANTAGGRICRSSSPTTSSAAPYIGDESMSVPPRSKNAFRTGASASRSGPGPASNVREVPSPTTGSSSPVEGIRFLIGVRDADRAGVGTIDAAAAIPSPATKRRRVSDWFQVSIVLVLLLGRRLLGRVAAETPSSAAAGSVTPCRAAG